MNYYKDEIGARCLELAGGSKARAGFGAVLLNSNGEIISDGRNRLSRKGDYDILGGGVDYGVHAEQSAAIEAIENGYDIYESEIYVIGIIMRGDQKGCLTVRASDNDKYFSCIRCAKMFNRFDISVNIPLPSGWHKLSPREAFETAKQLKAESKKLAFTSPIKQTA